MRPIGTHIILKETPMPTSTSSGLMLSAADTAAMRYKAGVVIAVGDQVATIKKDETIYYDKRQSFSMLIHDEPYTIIHERDVVVVL